MEGAKTLLRIRVIHWRMVALDKKIIFWKLRPNYIVGPEKKKILFQNFWDTTSITIKRTDKVNTKNHHTETQIERPQWTYKTTCGTHSVTVSMSLAQFYVTHTGHLNRPGLFYGQCSEICGANHSFIPIVIERISTNNFINWISRINE